jgi:integrase
MLPPLVNAVQSIRRLPRLTPHDLRHTAPNLAVRSGENVKAVQRMLGHASAAMTLDVYADLLDDDLAPSQHGWITGLPGQMSAKGGQVPRRRSGC